MKKQFTIKSRIKEMQLLRARIIFAFGLIICLTLLLIGRLFTLQVVRYDFYKMLSIKNQVDFIPIAPSRGLIFDRHGKVLAENVPVFSLVVLPNEAHHLKDEIAAIQKFIDLSSNDLDQFYRQLREYRRFDKVPLKLRLTPEEVAKFSVNRYRFPGVSIKTDLIRHYPFGDVLSGITGYVGRINGYELLNLNASDYAGTNFMGKRGVEQYYEALLHGQVGYRKVETDASGQVVREFYRKLPQNGSDIYLTIDADLQRAAMEVFADLKIQGALVAIDPQTGDILAMVSYPSFDANVFVQGISQKAFDSLMNDPGHPLFNRAIRGLYPPGSVIKPFVALGGLNEDVVTPDFQLFDPGYYKLQGSSHVFHDWKRGGHGWVNLASAIIQSCDTYFYDLSHHMGISRLDAILREFGFGSKTGIDMSSELSGTVPDEQWKLIHRGTSWFPGDTVITGIGQGALQVTPLQLAFATATLSQKGKAFKPHLLYAVKANGEKAETRTLNPSEALQPITLKKGRFWDLVIDAMSKVVTKGTGFRFGTDTAYSVAAKTGTAQVFSLKGADPKAAEDLPLALRNNSTFIAFAPVSNPRIAMAVVVEHGLSAPVVTRRVMDRYFRTPVDGQS